MVELSTYGAKSLYGYQSFLIIRRKFIMKKIPGNSKLKIYPNKIRPSWIVVWTSKDSLIYIHGCQSVLILIGFIGVSYRWRWQRSVKSWDMV